MLCRIWMVMLLLLITATPARAQLVVIDVANLIQAILIAQRAQRHYEELLAQYRTILRMSRRLNGRDDYRVPAVPMTRHDPSRWEYGRSWIEGLNTGDPSGTRYWATTLPLEPPDTGTDHLTAAAREFLERQYATIEITDSVAFMGGHQAALVRGYHGELHDAVDALEGDVLDAVDDEHNMTAILDTIAAGELLARRQDMATNQVLSHTLEQLLARGKRLRDTEAATMNMQLVTWRDGAAANRAFVAGSSEALRSWRQP
jgi:hypothetical protein